MTTIFDLPIEILTHISVFMPRIYWKFFRDSNKYFKENLSPKISSKSDDEENENAIIVNYREIFDAMIYLEKNGFNKYSEKFLGDNELDSEFHCDSYLKFIRHGYLGCLKYLMTEKALNKDFRIYFRQAIQSEQLDILDWLSENVNFDKNSICIKAVKYGKLSVLKWARSRNYPWNNRICWVATRKRNAEILKWITENGQQWDTDICLMAAKNGNLKVLKFIKKNNYEWDADAYEVAKDNCHDKIVCWIKENDLPRDKSKELNEVCPSCSNKIIKLSSTETLGMKCNICSSNDNYIYCSNCLIQCLKCRKNYCTQCNFMINCQSCNKDFCRKCTGPRCIECKNFKCCYYCTKQYQYKCLDCYHGDDNRFEPDNSILQNTDMKMSLPNKLVRYTEKFCYSAKTSSRTKKCTGKILMNEESEEDDSIISSISSNSSDEELNDM